MVLSVYLIRYVNSINNSANLVEGLNGVRESFIHIGACVCVCLCVCLDKRLIDCGDLKTKVRVSFIVLATLW